MPAGVNVGRRNARRCSPRKWGMASNRNLHARPCISSQSELFALLLGALEADTAVSGRYPLESQLRAAGRIPRFGYVGHAVRPCG